MKEFLAIYMGRTDSAKMDAFRALDDATRKKREAEGMKAWTDWMIAHKDAVAVSGGPLGKTKRADSKGVSDIRNQMSGYVVVRAADHAAAAKMFENHPHFTIFPGDSVEIMEVLPMPR
jgi:hypothetical protein